MKSLFKSAKKIPVLEKFVSEKIGGSTYRWSFSLWKFIEYPAVRPTHFCSFMKLLATSTLVDPDSKATSKVLLVSDASVLS